MHLGSGRTAPRNGSRRRRVAPPLFVGLWMWIAVAVTASSGATLFGETNPPRDLAVLRAAHADAAAGPRALPPVPMPAPPGGPSRAEPAVSQSAAGTGPSWEGVYEEESYLAPADPTGAIGPSVFVQLVNDRVGIYDRSGNVIARGPMSALTGIADATDPQVLWDPYTQRFYYLVLNAGNNSLAWGFSKGPAPSSLEQGFCRYGSDFGYGARIPDYPKLGQTTEHLLVGVNVFGSSFQGADVLWITKPQGMDPIQSCPPLPSFRTGRQTGLRDMEGNLITTPVPAIQTDPSPTGWVVSAGTTGRLSGTDNLILFRVSTGADGAAAIEGTGKAVPVPPADAPRPALQLGGPPIDTLDGRLTQAVSAIDPTRGADGRLAIWTTHAVSGGAGAEQRWYQIDPNARSLLQAGSVSSASESVYNGAIAPDRAVRPHVDPDGTVSYVGRFGSGMAMGVNTSGPATFVAVKTVTKSGAAPQSPLGTVKVSEGPYVDLICAANPVLALNPVCRWGDYSGASPDPSPDPGGVGGAVWLSNSWTMGSVDTGLISSWRTWNWRATP